MIEKRALQVAVAIAGLVPVIAGAAGALQPRLLSLDGAAQALTHAAYLSGLLLGIGLAFWSLIPTIERQRRMFTTLTAIVVVGGLARLALAARLHAWGVPVLVPLAMELGVTPLLCLWQRRVSSFSGLSDHLCGSETPGSSHMALIGPGGRPVTSQPAQNAASGVSPHIKDSGLATFAADVLEASRGVPVIVDFWAPWCGPCKTLGPALEAAVEAANGAVKLVKVNIDENPEIAQQLRIQSIPTVYAFRDGQPVDGFMGAIPESQIKAFVAALAGGEAGHAHDHGDGEGHDHEGHDHGHDHGHGGPEHTAEVLAVAGEALAAGDIAMAAQAYGHVLQDEPGHPQAVAGAGARLSAGRRSRTQPRDAADGAPRRCPARRYPRRGG